MNGAADAGTSPAAGTALTGATGTSAPDAGANTSAGVGNTVTPPANAAATTPPAGAEWKLKVPEGFAEDEGFKSFSKMAQDAGLKSEAAQKFLEMHAANMRAASSASRQDAEASVLKKYGLEGSEKWEEQLKADKDIGGAEFNANVQAAQRVVQRFGTPALKEWFQSSGLGNHPELVRFVVGIGKAMGEDSVASAAGKGAAANASTSDTKFYEALYPTMHGKSGLIG